MKNSVLILAGAAMICVACSSIGTSSSTTSPKGAKGDLAYYELRGNVKTMTENGATYNFDEDGRLIIDPADGKVEISKDPDNGLTYYTYSPVGEDPFEYWSAMRPYRRGYDKDGRLREIAYHYEMWIGLFYNEDGTVSREDWAEESWGGCSFYNYQGGVRSTAVNQSGEIVELSGIMDEEILWDDFVCYSYDECGNWTARFGISHFNGNVNCYATKRTIEYYSKDKTDAIDHSLEGLILSGTIGADAIMCLTDLDTKYYGPNGVYQLETGGPRVLSAVEYDRDNGHLVMEARYRNGDVVGTFDGMLRLDGKPGYKGVFTNEKAKTVDFELSVL